MNKKTEPLPIPEGNGRRIRTIEFDEADAPLLMAAMRLSASTARLYGTNQRKAMARLKYYQQIFMSFAPPESRFFSEEADWCEIAIEMENASGFSVEWEKGSWPDYEKGRATVTIGKRKWSTSYHDKITQEQAEKLAEVLEEMAPAGCLREKKSSKDDSDA